MIKIIQEPFLGWPKEQETFATSACASHIRPSSVFSIQRTGVWSLLTVDVNYPCARMCSTSPYLFVICHKCSTPASVAKWSQPQGVLLCKPRWLRQLLLRVSCKSANFAKYSSGSSRDANASLGHCYFAGCPGLVNSTAQCSRKTKTNMRCEECSLLEEREVFSCNGYHGKIKVGKANMAYVCILNCYQAYHKLKFNSK